MAHLYLAMSSSSPPECAHSQRPRDTSQELRQRRGEKRNAQMRSSRGPRQEIKEGDYVWLVYRDWERAAYIRKHGKGQPWKRRYLVLKVDRLYGVKLAVKDGRGVLEWQPRRRISLSPPELHGDGENIDPERPNEIGAYKAPGGDSGEAASDDDEGQPEPRIRKIVDARYERDHLTIYVEWEPENEDSTGVDVVPSDHATVLRGCRNPTQRSQLDQVVEIARLRAGLPEDSTGNDGGDLPEETQEGNEGGTFSVLRTLREEGIHLLQRYYRDMTAAFRFIHRGKG